MKKARTMESLSMSTLPKGAVFFSTKKDAALTAIATYYKRKIRTERLLTLTKKDHKLSNLTKVTLI